MALDKRLPYNWHRVRAGDIVSFRYKSNITKESKINTILILNPRLAVTLKDGTKKEHLIGIKLEENNEMDLVLTAGKIAMFEKIGKFESVDKKNNLFRLKIDERLILGRIRGVKERAYDLIARSSDIKGQYRTYDWDTAKANAVYLEPIMIFTDEN